MTDANREEALSTKIAQKTADRLCDKELIPATKKEELTEKLMAGTITAQDWRLLLELGLPVDEGEEKDAPTP